MATLNMLICSAKRCARKKVNSHYEKIGKEDVDEVDNVDFCVDAGTYYVSINFFPLMIQFFSNDHLPILVVNERGLLNFGCGKP